MLLQDWPAVTDDTGPKTDGTIWNKALHDAIKASVEGNVHSTTNPTVQTKDIIDEVVVARGNLADLDARISGVVDDDGNPVAQAGLITGAQAASFIGQRSHAKNDEMADWPSGAAAAPGDFTLSGTGAAVARCGAGEADTTTLGAGTYCAKLTYGSAAARLTQSVFSTAEMSKWSQLRGKKIFVGIRAKASVANQASLAVDDGVTTTRGGETGNGTYHSGDGSTHWIYALHTIDSSATKLDVYLETATSGAAYFGGLVVVMSEISLGDWSPGMVVTLPTNPVGAIVNDTGAYQVGATGSFQTMRTANIPAGYFSTDGKWLRVHARGQYTNNGNTKDTRIGVAGTVVVTNGSGAHTAGFEFDVWLIRINSNTLHYVAKTTRNMQQVTGGAGTITSLTFANALAILVQGNMTTATTDATLYHILAEGL